MVNHKPSWHLTPPQGWMNDPNGPLFFDGWYHIFYQHNPNAAVWDTMHWGHARSQDLILWEHLPIVLRPSTDKGETHCFSGCAVIHNNIPAIVYTSIGEGERDCHRGAEQWLAYGSAEMEVWQKKDTPLLTQAIHGGDQILEWRDPFIWREGGIWNMILGGSTRGHGCITLYHSSSLSDWHYDGVLFEDQEHDFLECPNMLCFGEKKILFYSPSGNVTYHIGGIQEGKFISRERGIVDYSGLRGFYAPNTLLNDPLGRYLTWGWITENDKNGLPAENYSGALSLPRLISLSESGELIQEPAPEIQSIFAETERRTISLNTNTWNKECLFRTRGRELALNISTEYTVEDDFCINLYKEKNNREITRIHYNASLNEIILEKTNTSLAPQAVKEPLRATIKPRGKIEIQIFLDHSLIEIFVNRHEAMSGRLYPTLPESDMISISGKVKKMEVTILKRAAS